MEAAVAWIAKYGPFAGAAGATWYIYQASVAGSIPWDHGALILTAVAFGCLLYGQLVTNGRDVAEIIKANSAMLSRVADALEDRTYMTQVVERLENLANRQAVQSCPFAEKLENSKKGE